MPKGTLWDRPMMQDWWVHSTTTIRSHLSRAFVVYKYFFAISPDLEVLNETSLLSFLWSKPASFPSARAKFSREFINPENEQYEDPAICTYDDNQLADIGFIRETGPIWSRLGTIIQEGLINYGKFMLANQLSFRSALLEMKFSSWSGQSGRLPIRWSALSTISSTSIKNTHVDMNPRSPNIDLLVRPRGMVWALAMFYLVISTLHHPNYES